MAALVEAAEALVADACDRGEARPGRDDDEDPDNPWPRDADGDPWFQDYYDLMVALAPFLTKEATP